MKALKIILIVIVTLLVIILAVCGYYGAFGKVEFRIEEQGGEVLVYENMLGDYSQTAEVTNRIYYDLLNNEKIETTKGFGIYLDNPQEVETSKLRSEVGCILDNPDSALIARLSEKYNIKILPVGNYVITEFPFKGKISILFGIMKVYPALHKFCEEHNISGGAIMEIYDVSNKKIIYRDLAEVNK